MYKCIFTLPHVVDCHVINPRCACAERVTVVVSCVCMYTYVCLSAHAILEARAIISITKDAIVLSVRFAAILKWSYSKVRASFTPSAGAAIFVDAYSACNVSYTLRYMFAYA